MVILIIDMVFDVKPPEGLKDTTGWVDIARNILKKFAPDHVWFDFKQFVNQKTKQPQLEVIPDSHDISITPIHSGRRSAADFSSESTRAFKLNFGTKKVFARLLSEIIIQSESKREDFGRLLISRRLNKRKKDGFLSNYDEIGVVMDDMEEVDKYGLMEIKTGQRLRRRSDATRESGGHSQRMIGLNSLVAEGQVILCERRYKARHEVPRTRIGLSKRKTLTGDDVDPNLIKKYKGVAAKLKKPLLTHSTTSRKSSDLEENNSPQREVTRIKDEFISHLLHLHSPEAAEETNEEFKKVEEAKQQPKSRKIVRHSRQPNEYIRRRHVSQKVDALITSNSRFMDSLPTLRLSTRQTGESLVEMSSHFPKLEGSRSRPIKSPYQEPLLQIKLPPKSRQPALRQISRDSLTHRTTLDQLKLQQKVYNPTSKRSISVPRLLNLQIS
eukprot:TRINITY_DN1423_c0_g1_i2.p1 TRINITY_DN1423_c0_g1~~TRINITY_DN1423_c0_g1_i2.p1  ORF type:complete len:441 (-),score=57.12 TRINITY_DN1423_c0_g1_i2:93-1415(-)